ncbi:gluconolactonase [Komagataeibacter nataicola]|uniref:Gluconolactonase n=1 Tax=Komagataeibacter nataicola TaxID=265960 RepID=A0A9N7H3I2_9PROT|nr:L-dopachrome tautomerase-related protein [Komagataeibacter nataicola]AQU88443.1 gluconolactonase [Komagataeibacter nataicola]PYD67140.1 gluconolactonase [Komagataeibacter nataicola]WEQ54455.1 L-dopachrome tautomerase-related protein [Komagataeibacter nataicola]GBR17398.1 gluconolactonase [Komagataeibacter nataicola NRIC 0616]
MKTRLFSRLFHHYACGAALLALLAPLGAHARDSVDHGAAPSGNVTVVARFADMQPSGIAALPDGRLVIAFPRSAADHKGPRLGQLVKGKAIPFPDEATQARFISPLGMTVDTSGHLWIVDEGTVAGQAAPATPALIGLDPGTGQIIATIALGPDTGATRADSHVNDVRVDLTHGEKGTAFISDTSQMDHPAIIVVDIATGHARRVLENAPSVRAEAGFAMELDGKMLRYDMAHPAMGQGGIDGVALSTDSSTLYWQPLSSRRLYSAPTALLANPATRPAQLEHAVRDEGEDAVVDGMATGPDNSLYLTDIERHAVLRRQPDGQLSVVAHDPRLIAPDGLAIKNDALWLTVGQWGRLPVFHDGHDMEERPWLVVKIPLK